MNREGDVNFSLAFDAGIIYSVILKNTAATPVPINVTGYSARMQILRYDGSRYGSQIASLVSGVDITVGTTDGLFTAAISAALATTIGDLFGGVPPSEPLRYRFFATPPAGTEAEIAHGGIALLEAGETVAPVTATVQSITNTIVVSALAPAGPPGPDGDAGPEGPPLIVATRSGSLPQRSKHRPGGYTYDGGAGDDETIEDLAREDIRRHGASSTAVQTTITATAGASTATFGASSGLKKGNWVFAQRGGVAHGMGAPTAPIVIQQGTTGATTVSVQLVYYSRLHGYSAPSAATVITNANASPSQTNFIQIWHTQAEATANGADFVLVYLQFGGSGGTHTYRGGFIANAMPGLGRGDYSTSFRLHSTASVTAPAGIPANSTGLVATTNGMWTQLTSDLDAGNVASISPALKTSVTAAICFPDSVIPIIDAIRYVGSDDAGGEVVVPFGVFPCATSVGIHRAVRFVGASSGQARSGSVLLFRAGCGLEMNCRTTALKRSPGEPIRVGDRRIATRHTYQPGYATASFVTFEAISIAASATWGWTAASGDPTWDFTPGANTVDGDVTWRAAATWSTADGLKTTGLLLGWSNLTLPAGQYTLPDDLQQSSWHELNSPVGAGENGSWAAGITSTSTNRWIYPTSANATGLIYEATTPGTSGGTEPTWPRTIGATVVDNTTTWTARDAPRQQGVGLLISCRVSGDIGLGYAASPGIPGTGFLLNGDITTNGAQCNGVKLWVQENYAVGHGGAAVGSDGQVGDIFLHTAHQSGISWQDDSFFGNTVYVRNGGGALIGGQIGYGGPFYARNFTGAQNRRKGSVQQSAVLNGYTEGTPSHDWNAPGIIGYGYNMHGLRSGATAGFSGYYLAGISSYSQDLAVVRQWNGQEEQFGSTAGTPSLRTAWQERRDFDFASGKLFTRLRAGTTQNVWAQRVYSNRGRLTEFLNGAIVGPAEALFTSISAVPALGFFRAGDFLRWGGSNYRAGIRPSQPGCVGQIPRVNSTAYPLGTILTSSSRCFAVVSVVSSTVNGTTDSSPPAALATAVLDQFIQDGTLWLQCCGPDQDPLFVAEPLRNATPVVMAASTSTLTLAGGTSYACPSTASNFTKTLGTTDAMVGDGILIRNTSGGAGVWTIANGGGGGGNVAVFPTLTDFWVWALFDGTNWYKAEGGGF